MTVDIIGTGNVGSHLYHAFQGKADLNSVPARTLAGLRTDSDCYILCVSDDAIDPTAEAVASKIPVSSILLHTSGSTPLKAISVFHDHCGVLYPLQTFSKQEELEYSTIPVLIEGSSNPVFERVRYLAGMISDEVHEADSEQRTDIHLASVFVNNFSNHLWHLADCYLKKRGQDFSLLKPLLQETLRKALARGPKDAQTGPAKRGDLTTISRHLDRLAEEVNMREIYETMTRSIIKEYQK